MTHRCAIDERRDDPDSTPLWERMVEHSPAAMCLVGPVGELLSANGALRAMLGYTEAELLG